MTVLLLEPVSFSGIAEAITECTLKTAQPDGKTSCKETSCETLETEYARRNANNFAVGLRRKKQSKIVDYNPLTATQISDDQVTKGAGWMPWHWTPKKDVVSCEKPRGAASRL